MQRLHIVACQDVKDPDLRLSRRTYQGPVLNLAAIGIAEADSDMTRQVRRASWHSPFPQIGGRCTQQQLEGPKRADHDAAVGQVPVADGDINAFIDKIDDAVSEIQVKFDSRIE